MPFKASCFSVATTVPITLPSCKLQLHAYLVLLDARTCVGSPYDLPPHIFVQPRDCHTTNQ